MSLMAMIWADWLAPVPLTDRGTRHTNSWAVLHVLAETAADDGSDAFPSLAVIQHVTGISERGVRGALRSLEDAGAIVPSAAPIVSVKIARGDRRPNSYDLNMRGAVRWDLTDEDLDDIARRQPLLEPYVDRMRAAREDARADGRFFQPPAADALDDPSDPVDNPPARGARRAGRGARRAGRPAPGAPRDGHGGHVVPERGARRAPEPLLEPRVTQVVENSHQGNDARPVENHDVIDLRDRPSDRPARTRSAPGHAEAMLAAARATLALRSGARRPLDRERVPVGLEDHAARAAARSTARTTVKDPDADTTT